MKLLKTNSCRTCPMMGREIDWTEPSGEFYYCKLAAMEHPTSSQKQFIVDRKDIPDFCPLPDDLNQQILNTIDEIEAVWINGKFPDMDPLISRLGDLRNRSKQLI